MTKLKTLIAATLITLPVLALDAAQLPIAQDTAPAISAVKPTTNFGCCIFIIINGMMFCIPC
jgi:hypothetical protein